jgi:hypothetical protein
MSLMPAHGDCYEHRTMAKYTIAEMCQKILAVQAGLREKKSTAEACKSAGVTSATYKRWLTANPKLSLPSFVLDAPHNGDVTLSHDGNWLFLVADTVEGFALSRFDTTRGALDTSALVSAPRGSSDWREVLTVRANADGSRLMFVASDGALREWDVRANELRKHGVDLGATDSPLGGKAGSGARRWAYVAIAPDLVHIAYWTGIGSLADERTSHLNVRRIEDGAEVFRYEMAALFTVGAIEFHPTLPRIAVYNSNNLTTVLDYALGEAVLEDGPQVHGLSFVAGDTLLYDDWYARTQELDLATGESRLLAKGWAAHASMSDRYVTAEEKHVTVRSRSNAKSTRTIPFEGVRGRLLSRDGERLVIVADKVCLWNLGAPAADE